MQRILGIDPGVRAAGWCVLDCDPAGRNLSLKLVGCGVIKTRGDVLSSKLLEIHNHICGIVAEHCPSHAAIEIIFCNKNLRSSLVLESARGAILLSCSILGLSISEYHANKVKEVIVGKGHAQKQQVQYIVERTLDFSGLSRHGLTHDAYDACAIALCHAYSHRTVTL